MRTPYNMAAQSQVNRQISFRQSVVYALPTVTVAFLFGPIVILQGIYAKYFGLSLTTIASVILIARLFDAITDPVIGYFSDQYFKRSGSRKIFVLVGGLLFIPSSYFLYVPFDTNSLGIPDNVSAAYFLACFLFFYLSYTFYEVPHLAWGSEMTFSSEERNKIYSLRALASYLGLLLFFSVPMLPFFETSEFTPKTLSWAVVIAGTLMIPLLFLCMKMVPSTRREKNSLTSKDPSIDGQSFLNSGKNTERSIFTNQPFLLFISAFFFTGTGVGMSLGVMFIFVDAYLGLGENLSLIYLISYGSSILTLGLWYRVANILGKKTAWNIGLLLMLIGTFGIGFITPEGSQYSNILMCMILVNTGSLAVIVLAPSILADIVDYSRLRFSRNCGATYFSIYTLVTKANVAIGGALGLAIAGYFGFDPTSSFQSDSALHGIRLSIAWIPSLTMLSSMFLVAMVPINNHRHKIIQRRLSTITARSFEHVG